MELNGRVAVVTGGGRGLGARTCEVLAGRGAKVAVLDLRAELARETADRLRAGQATALAFGVDVGDAAGVDEAFDQVVRELGGVDVLVNNAGVDVTLPIEEITVEQFERVVRTNLIGPVIASRRAFTAMRERGGGHVVNIVSTAAKRAWPNASAYHATKWGLLGFSHALHVEGRQVGIKVTAVIAGGMRTPFLTERFPDLDLATLQDPQNVAETVRMVLEQPAETVIPEIMVLPMRETSWP